jgi:protein O-GlcNAc transferase
VIIKGLIIKQGNMKKNLDVYRTLAKDAYQQKNIKFALHVYETLIINDQWVASSDLLTYAQLLQINNEYSKAIRVYRNILDLNPSHDIHSNLAECYLLTNNLNDAEYHLNEAYKLNPKTVEIIFNLGMIKYKNFNFIEAAKFFYEAVNIDPNFIQAWGSLADTSSHLRRLDDCVHALNQVLKLNCKAENIRGFLFLSKMELADWTGFYEEKEKIYTELLAGNSSINPFHSLMFDDLQFNFLSAKLKASNFATTQIALKLKKGKKIVVGYFSPDFKSHPITFLISDHIKLVNRNEFVIIGFSMAPATNDTHHESIKGSFDYFVDVSNMFASDIVKVVRDHNVDIAIDLAGYTNFSKPEIFSLRAAPIQINFLGHIGTLGAEFMDYIIADKIVIPENNISFFTEKIIYMPDTFHVTSPSLKPQLTCLLRSDFGISQDKFVFCCLNNIWKITPLEMDAWSIILNRVANGVLLLYVDNLKARQNIMNEASIRGIAVDRIFFLERTSYENYLSRYSLADLFLDTFNYNGGATVSDALWAGLPVLTLLGNNFQGRMAASILSAIGMEELISHNTNDYINIAVNIALNKSKHDFFKAKLKNNAENTSLFNPQQFTLNLEKAFKLIHHRYQNNLPNQNIFL